MGNLHKNPTKSHFQIAEDSENAALLRSPIAKTPIARQLFSKISSKGKENADTSYHNDVVDERPAENTGALWSPVQLTQDTEMTSEGDDVFSPPATQSTQPTQAGHSFRHSIHDEDEDEDKDQGDGRHDTGDSFVSANEGYAKKQHQDDAMDIENDKADTSRSDAEGTVVHHDLGSADEDEDEVEDEDDGREIQDVPEFPQPSRVVSEQYSISAETHEALHMANQRVHATEYRSLLSPKQSTTPAGLPPASPDATQHDDTVVHHNVHDQIDIDDDARSPSSDSSSSPVKPLVRKSSLTFASLPAREPILAKKSMGNRISRISHLDQHKARSSHLGRYTGGKSLGASQAVQPVGIHHDDPQDELLDVEEQRPEPQREESETAKMHSQTSTQRLFDRINMLKQQNKAPKPVNQPALLSQPSQPQSIAAHTLENEASTQVSQPSYPHLPEPGSESADDDDDWISAPAPGLARPLFSKSHSANTQTLVAEAVSKLTSTSDPDLSAVAESTTPVGSPVGKKQMDGPLTASKAKFYSALRAAKEKIIGSSAASAQVKIDAFPQSPMRPKPQALNLSDDMLSSPMRSNKSNSIFSHMRSPSKDSVKSNKMPSSPLKEESRRTRSSTEREKRKEKETQEKDVKDAKQKRSEERLKEMREKEQSKAAAQHQKSKMATSKLHSAMLSQTNIRQGASTPVSKPPVAAALPPQQHQPPPLPRPISTRIDTASASDETDSADEMPPPPPKSLLPTTKITKAALREPRKLVKPTSKDALPKAKAPQKIMVNLNSSRYGQAPPPAARPASAAANRTLPAVSQTVAKSTAPASKAAPTRPASALSKSAGPGSRTVQPAPKPAAPRVGRPQPQAVEKPKAPAPPRADLGTARPVSRMQTVQDANRIVIPPINPAKPAKRPFQGENDETLHRPAKRPSQQAKMNPITPAHAQFAKGKIPFAEPTYPSQSQPPQQPQIAYPNSDDIKLPEIMTDSEDEDSDNEFEQPSWVNTPNLREMLSTQQLMDPEQIFGPIAPLNMEQVFPNKERHKRFRERTSSAYWANDELTSEEKRKEREARERLVREGAWTYNPSPRPTPRPGPSH